MGHRLKLAAALLWLSACAEVFPRPMSAAMVAHYNSGAALTAYLAQPGAQPEVCDMQRHGPHIRRLWAKDGEALVDGLIEGAVPPPVWRACVNALLDSAPPTVLREFMHEAGYGFRELIGQTQLESNPRAQAALLELNHLYLERPHTLQPQPEIARKLFAELREALAKQRFGPLGTKLGTRLLEAYDLEHGLWKGHALDVAALDDLFNAQDAAALHLILSRGSSELLRSEAKRRLIRLHIAASQFAEVKADPAGVEETLMRRGFNAQSPETHRVVSGNLDPLPWQSVIVYQDFERQTANLFGRGPSYDGASELPLLGALHVQLEGISRPITLCADPDALDPTPCLLDENVSVGEQYARVHDNALQLRTGIRIADALALARSGGKLDLRVRVAGVAIDNYALPVHFDRRDRVLAFYADDARYGEPGPALRVVVDCPNSELLSFTASEGGEARSAFVPVAALQNFALESRGAPGHPGAVGSSGWSGSSGAACQDGQSGGNGGMGGPGGPGGDGGDIRVEIACRDGVHAGVGFALLRDALWRSVHSLGGPGGPGGSGGRGGRGGSGGMSRSKRTHLDRDGREVVDDPGCSAGHNGLSGFDGASGPPGPDGRPGVVTIAPD
jgi:hypothetical protein